MSSGLHVEGDGGLLRAAFAGHPAEWLPPPAVALDRQRWLVGVRWAAVDRLTPCQLLPYRSDGPAGWRHLVWEPDSGREPDREPPHLEGELGLLVPDGSGRGAELTFSGSYVPPFGVFGIAGETAALYEATVAAVRDFLRDLAAGLSAAVAAAQPREGSRTP